jgi:hypothetical protein
LFDETLSSYRDTNEKNMEAVHCFARLIVKENTPAQQQASAKRARLEDPVARLIVEENTPAQQQASAKRARLEDPEPLGNYSLVLEILLMMPHILCPETLLSTALVSKECCSLTRRAWTLVRYTPVSMGLEAASFRNPDLTMSGSEAKKKYKLCDADLDKMECTEYYNKFRVVCRSFLKSDALAFALVKNKGPAGLRAICQKKTGVSAAKAKRIVAVCTRFEETDLVVLRLRGKKFYDHVIAPYLSGGIGKVREFKSDLEKWVLVKQRVREIDATVPLDIILKARERVVVCGEQLESCLESCLQEHRERQDKEKRRGDLRGALGQCGLVIRGDSRLCAQFIESGVPGLEQVVATMRQMNFLYKKTRYASLLSKSIEGCKREIREIYGWLSPEEFGEYIRDHVKDVQSSIKKKALSRYSALSTGFELPDYMLPILN